MKQYPITDVRGDKYLNPAPPETRSVSKIASIIVHHDAVVRPHDYDTMARLRNEAAVHYNNLGPGLQYHYSIDNVGEIFWVRPHEATLWHAGNLAVNRTSLAIKLDGYFHPGINQVPTKEQLEALQQLLDKLCFQHPEFPATQQNVFGHREIVGTACPGDNMINRVVSYRNSKVVPLEGTVYDWPEYQPSTPAPAPEAPAPTPPSVEVNYRVFKAGKQIGAYKTDSNAWNKYKAESADNIMTSSGQDVTAQLKVKFEPVVPPPPEVQNDHEIIVDTNEKVNAILVLLTKLWEAVKKIFNLGEK